MPRLSAEARAAQSAIGVGKLNPSPHLGVAERRAWRIIVAATPAGHLSERDRPLLEGYVTLTIAQRKLSSILAQANPRELLGDGLAADALARAEAISRALATLSMRLKFGPLAGHSTPQRAGQRNEPTNVGRLLGGLKAVK